VTALGSLLVPVLRWDPTHGFAYLEDSIGDALELGVGGFLIRGGPRDAVAELAAALHERSRVSLLLAADVERGAGQQFEGCIALPPLGAIGHALASPGSTLSLDDVRRSAKLTARDLKRLHLNWALAPVCDLDIGAGSPIVGTRSAGAGAAAVSAVVEEWIDACQAEGVLACAKHFPGHGRASEDSHRTMPVVRTRAADLTEEDLAPFRAALDAGVASVMTAHVAFPTLDPTGAPCTLSAPILRGLLRSEMRYDGLIVTDALEMDGLLSAGTEADVAVRAVAAGCDVLLAPMDVTGVVRALDRAAQDGTVLGADRVRDALERRDRWALWARSAPGREPTLDDEMWARQLADRTVSLLRGTVPRLGAAVEVVEVDDDTGGAWTVPSRVHFTGALGALDLEAPVVGEPTSNTRVPVLVAAYADVVAWKGTAGFSDASVARVERAIASAGQRETLLVLFSHPRWASQFPSARNVLCAWGGELPMQTAAARVIVRGAAS